jgi:hypothetical protein
MKLGTRWPAHTPPPQALTEDVKAAALRVETELTALGQDTHSWYWTLTYLENKPVVQLDDGTTIRLSDDGKVSITQED